MPSCFQSNTHEQLHNAKQCVRLIKTLLHKLKVIETFSHIH